MLPNEIPFCFADIRLSAENFEVDIARDPYDGLLYDGFRDYSGMGNHLLVRQGAITFEERDGIEGAIFDGAAVASCRQSLRQGAGTLVASFADGYKVNTSRYPFTFETYRATKTRTGNPSSGVLRLVGSGNNRIQFGIPGQTVTVALGGASGGDATVQRVACASDRQTGRNAVYGKREGQALQTNTPATTRLSAILGADVVVGRLDSSVGDAARVALPGSERLWLSHLYLFGNLFEGNLPVDKSDELDDLWSQMATD